MAPLTTLLMLVTWLILPSVEAQQNAQQTLRSARSLRCSFPTGVLVNLATDPPSREEAPGPTVAYDAIDRDRGRARLIGTVASGDIQVLVGTNTLAFVEMTPTGTPIITVVYGQFRQGTRQLVATISKHFGHFGPPESVVIVAQYYGSCQRLE